MSQLQVTGEAKIRDIQGPVVANSGVITALDGAASQYVRGDGTLADFPTSSGGGSSVSYYLNSSVSQGTIGGVAYRELSKDPIIGAGTDIPISANGYVASYITDVNDPDVVIVPGGNFNCEFYFSVSNDTGNPTTYAELYKYDGTTFTLLGTSAGVPESINQGTTIAPYYFAIPVATAALSVTDRLAIRIYVNVDGRTVTLHTENGHLCQVVTTLSKGMVSLNNLTDQSQFLTTGTAGTNFAIASSGDTHTFNLPVASATNTGKLSSTDWSTFNGKVPYTGATGSVDLGNNDLTADGIYAHNIVATKDGIASGFIGIEQATGSGVPGTGFSLISSSGNFFELKTTTGIANTKLANIDLSGLTNNTTRTYTLPDASGTLALTSNLSAYVPYTGATGDVFLGTNSITGAIGTFTQGVFNGNGTNPANLYLKKGSAPFFTNANNYGLIAAVSSSFILISDVDGANYKYASFNLGSLTNNTQRAYTLPDLSGTLALLEGSQTFTGLKTFSNNVNINQQLFINGGTGYGGGISYRQGGILSTSDGSTTTEFPDANSIKYYVGQGSNTYKNFVFDVNNITLNATRTYSLPDASGTIALTSNLSSYVPYTGATTNVDLGANNLTANYLTSGNIVFWKGTGSGLGNIGLGRIVPLGQNTTGQVNIGIGENALFFNTTGSNNIALGGSANGNNTTGSSNIGIGSSANFANTTASNNIAIGLGALANNTTDNNVAIGHLSLNANTTGINNTAIGYATLGNGTTASNNVAIGYGSGVNISTGSNNTLITGGGAITTGSNNTIIGNYAGTSAMSNNIVLADGAGNVKYQWNGTNNQFTGVSIFNGNLTINPSTTDYTLTVSTPSTNNTIKLLGSTASNASTIGYWSSNSATQYGSLIFLPTNTKFEINNGGSFSIYTSGNERLTIASTGAVNLGTNELTSGNAKINDTLYLKVATTYAHVSGYYGIQVGTNLFTINNSASTQAAFSLASLTTSRTFTLPDSNGTLALTSQIPANPVGGTGTTNYLPKFTGTSTIGNSLVFDNGTNVGIGTATPATKLQVNGNITFGASHFIGDNAFNSLLIQSSATENILLDSQDDMLLQTNGTTKLIIKNGGNVGIGTNSPLATLVVGTQSTGTSGASFAADNSIVSRVGASYSGNTVVGLTIANTAAAAVNNEAALSFIVAGNYSATGMISTILTTTAGSAASDMIFKTYNSTFTEKMRITGGGNVLIGTTTDDGNKLQVNGSIINSGNLITKKSSGGGSFKQVVVGQKTAAASGVSMKIAYVGFTHAIRVYVWANQSTANGATAVADFTTIYGSSNGGVTYSVTLGNVSAISVSYDNGGSPAYTINVTLTYSGAAPTINFVVEGINNDNNIYVVN